jgi:hypothetical protein
MTTRSAQENPYLKALLHVGWVTLTLAVFFAAAGSSEAAHFRPGAVVQFGIAGWLAGVGSLAMLLWLFAGAIVWRPGTRARSDSRSSKSVWGAD